MRFPRLLKQQNVYFPTLFGWIMIIIVSFGFLFIFINSIHSFLAVSKPISSKVFIIEGWLPDYCLEQFSKRYDPDAVEKIFVTGGPLEQGSYLKEYKSLAAVGAETLKRLGVADSIIIEIPAPYVQKDRTFTSALALKKFLSNKSTIHSATIITLGVHARRSQLLFQKAFSNSAEIGVVSIRNKDYDPKYWFVSSMGVKTVLVEIISYIYTKLFFSKFE